MKTLHDIFTKKNKMRLYSMFCVFALSANLLAQKHMKFMGITMDGDIVSFCSKIETLGFRKEGNVTNAYCYVGSFLGEDAHIQVDYTHDTHTVYSVTIYIMKKTALELYPIQRNYLKALEEKYTYQKAVINPKLFQFDYYIFDERDPIGLIQTFIVSPSTSQLVQEAMLSITYNDFDNLLNYENRKRKDI